MGSLCVGLVLLTLATAAAPDAIDVQLVRVVGEGMSESDLLAATARVEEELFLMGAKARVRPGAPAELTCVRSPECAVDLLDGADGGLSLTLVRVGPLLQVEALVLDRSGVIVATSARSVNADGLAQTGSLLGRDLALAIRQLEPVSKDVPSDEVAADPPEVAAAPTPDETTPGGLFPLLTLGAGAAVAGTAGIVAVVAAAVGVQQLLAAYTAETDASVKELALVASPLGFTAASAALVVAVVGVAVATAGGAWWLVE